MARELNLIYGDALAEMGVCGPDRVVSAEDTVELGRIYASVWHLLDEMGLTSWEIDAAVPDGAALAVTWALAYHAAGPFGLTGDRLMRLAANGALGAPTPSLGERLLRKLSAPAYRSEPTAVEDY